MTSPLKINFVDYHKSFDITGNHIIKLLEKRFPIIISNNPDFLFYSDFEQWGILAGRQERHSGPGYHDFPHSLKIYTTEENRQPPFREQTKLQDLNPKLSITHYTCTNKCDYALTSNHSSDPRHLRLPIYVRQWFYSQPSLIKNPNLNTNKILKEKTKFCNFVYSNGSMGDGSKRRIDFFHKLSLYKKVTSGGCVLNNIGEPVKNKLDFLRSFKFTIAFENSSHSGYVTEKLIDPMLVHSLPIYWGNPTIEHDFNPKSFINAHDYSSDEKLITKIIELDNNDNLWCEYMSQPYFHNNIPNSYCHPEYLWSFFEKVFHGPRPLNNTSIDLNQITAASRFPPLWRKRA